jgi:Tol biopolymer transport system component
LDPPKVSRRDCDCPDWSPEDDYIAYCYQPFDTRIPEDTLGLYLYSLSDSTYFKILDIKTTHSLEDPDFSPDGRWLVFMWNYQIWKSTITGDSLQQLTFGGSNWSPDWSPDGRKIAYFHYTTGEDTSGVYIMNEDGTDKEHIVMGRAPVWIDNDSFVYSRSIINHDMAIYSYDISSKQKEKIIDYKEDWIWADNLALSRATFQLTFDTNEEEDVIAHLWLVNLDGTGLIEITPEGGGVSPAWSPDGSTIVYVNTQNGQIYLMDADGSNQRPLIYSGGESYENGRNNLGKEVVSGIYFLNFKMNGYVKTKKLILVK